MEKQRWYLVVVLLLLLVVNINAISENENYEKVSIDVIEEINEDDEVEIIVKLKDVSEDIESIEDTNLEIDHVFEESEIITGTADEEAIEELINDPNVESIKKDLQVKVFLSSSVPVINVDDVWQRKINNINITGTGQTICIIDTGIYYDHVNLGGAWGTKVLAGKNTVSNTVCTAENNECDDDHFHGTHVAGIIISNHSTHKGVAPDANLVAIKALNAAGGGSMGNVVEGIEWCIDNKDEYNISVISMSLGTEDLYTFETCPSDYDSEINSAYDAGITLVAASGNDGNTTAIGYPACHSKVISVGASNDDDTIYSNSNRIPDLDFLAPGSGITSMDNDHITDTKARSGTSMATPHVSGAIVLLQQFHKEKYGSLLDIQTIKLRLNSTGVSVSGFTRIDVLNATEPEIILLQPEKNNTHTNNNYYFFNITIDRMITSAILEIDSVNYTMSGSGNNFNYNVTNLDGLHEFRVYTNFSVIGLTYSDTYSIKMNNSAPQLDDYLPLNLVTSISENSTIEFLQNSSDNNGDDLIYYWYFNSTLQSNDASWDYTAGLSDSGSYNVTLIITDNYENTTISWNLTILDLNSAPTLTLIENISVYTDLIINNTINITVNAQDSENDTLYYSINMSEFSQSDNIFLWNVTYLDTGIYYAKIIVNDSNLNSSQIIKIEIGDLTDSDNDGQYDILDTDDDNDGLVDTNDNLKGNSGSITSFRSSSGGSSSSSLSSSILIDNSNDLVKEFDGEHNLTIKLESNITIEAITNMSQQHINLYNVTISKQDTNYNRGFLIIKGLQLSGTKTVYVDDVNASFNTVCVKNSEINNLSQISSGCNGANERLVTCNSLDTVYNCSRVDNNTRYRITGLTHSAIHEQCADNDEDGYGTGCPLGNDCNDNNAGIHSGCNTGGGGGGGNSGGSLSPQSEGGGGVSIEKEEDVKKSFFYDRLKKGEKQEIEINIDKLPIIRLSFRIINETKSSELALKSYHMKPKKVVSSPPSFVYKFMRIESDYLENNVRDVDINFRVNKSFIELRDLNVSSLKLYSYDMENDLWSVLFIKKISADSDYHYYSSETNNFNYLAISLDKNYIPEIEETIEETTDQQNENLITGQVAKDIKGFKIPSWIFGMWMCVIVVCGIWYRIVKNKIKR